MLTHMTLDGTDKTLFHVNTLGETFTRIYKITEKKVFNTWFGPCNVWC